MPQTTSSGIQLCTGELDLDVLGLVQRESVRAHQKHRESSIIAGQKGLDFMLAAGMEELGEVARAMVDNEGIDRVIAEWIQVANIGLSSVQAIRRFGIVR